MMRCQIFAKGIVELHLVESNQLIANGVIIIRKAQR